MNRGIGRLLRALLFVILSGYEVAAQGISSNMCPVAGGDNQTRLRQSTRERLFMNFGAPAQCNGTVTSWRYCYYNRYMEDDDECEDKEFYTSVFMVYRQTGPSTYELVPRSMKDVTLELRCPRDGGFQCREETFRTEAEQFEIQQNDIVAACLRDTSSTNPIRIVGEDRTSASGHVYQFNAPNYERCTASQVQTIDTQNSAFTLNNGEFRLHLYAATDTGPVVPHDDGGSNPPPFSPSLNSGTYLNMDHPITRSETITAWHYCYYPSAATDSQLTYTATVGVWRMNAAMNQYELVPGSDHTLELIQPPTTPARIFCKTEMLNPMDYASVQAGDVIGVSMPTQNPLPLVASDATGFNLMRDSGVGAPADLQMAALNDAPNMAMHLFPTIEASSIEPSVITREINPTTQELLPPVSRITDDGTTADENELWPTTDVLGEENAANEGEIGSKRLSRAYYIVIGLGALIIIIIILIIVAVIAYKCRKSRRTYKGPAIYGGGTGELEVSLTQQRLLTGSMVSTGSSLAMPTVPYFTKDSEKLYESIPSIKKQSILTLNEVEGSHEVYYSKLAASSSAYSSLFEQVVKGKKYEDEENPYFLPAKKENELYAQLHQQGIKSIRSDDIEITGVLGEGQFGTVHQGIWRNENSYILEVAVKTLKAGSEEKDKVKFLQEATIMAQFKHPNVVTLYGVVTSGGPMKIVVELLPNGDLQQHLINMKSDPEVMSQYEFIPRKLLGFCQQVALGMQYLSTKGFVHRDLATRNILLSEGEICKIADFGMSIDLAEETYYVAKGGRIPLKWTAPEALHYRKYSTASDIWGYGCLMYEIWGLGEKPFGATKNRKVISQIDAGYRLPPPPGCPKAIYKIMIDCWHPTTTERPGFRSILLALLDREDIVLKVPREIGKNSPAATLGAPLEAGYNMYTQLQNTYRSDYA